MALEPNTRREILKRLLTLGPVAAVAGAVAVNGAKTVEAATPIGDPDQPTNGKIFPGYGGTTQGSHYIAGNNNYGIGIDCNPAGKFQVLGSGSARYFLLDSHTHALLKLNDNSLQSILTLENTNISAANLGTAITFNLGYGGDPNTAGTPIAGGRITLASEQQWTSAQSSQDSYMTFLTTSDGALTERIRIDSSGNVGIGCVPASKLEIAGGYFGSAFKQNIVGTSSSTVGTEINATLQDAGGWTPQTVGAKYFQIGGTTHNGQASPNRFNSGSISLEVGSIGGGNKYSSDLVFRTLADSWALGVDVQATEKIRIKGSGNIGIGTASPAAKLDVNGPVRIAGDLTLVGGTLQGTAQTSVKSYYDS